MILSLGSQVQLPAFLTHGPLLPITQAYTQIHIEDQQWLLDPLPSQHLSEDDLTFISSRCLFLINSLECYTILDECQL